MKANRSTVRPSGMASHGDVSVDVPQQQVGIEVLVTDLGYPADAPRSERLDNRFQLLAGPTQLIADPAAVLPPFDDTRPDQGLQTAWKAGWATSAAALAVGR